MSLSSLRLHCIVLVFPRTFTCGPVASHQQHAKAPGLRVCSCALATPLQHAPAPASHPSCALDTTLQHYPPPRPLWPLPTSHANQHDPEAVRAGLGGFVPHRLRHQVQHHHLENKAQLKVVPVEVPPLAPGDSKAPKQLLVGPLLCQQLLLFKVHGSNAGRCGRGTQPTGGGVNVGFLQTDRQTQRQAQAAAQTAAAKTLRSRLGG